MKQTSFLRTRLSDSQPEPWRVALYIRLSREDRNAESLSILNQKKILFEYLDHSFDGAFTLAGVYIDDGKSGTDSDRPAFCRMIRDAEQGLVTCVVCKNLSRAFRNYSDQGYFLEDFFPRRGVRFIALDSPQVDTFLNPEALSGLEVPINGLLNDRYACKTSADVRRTFDTKRRKGEFIGAFAPYGYQKDPDNRNHLLIDPPAARIVRAIFLWYVYGDTPTANAALLLPEPLFLPKPAEPAGALSKTGIARRLNRLRIPNPTAYKQMQGFRYQNPQSGQNDGLWSARTVSAILSSEVYAGCMVQGKQRVISYKVHDRLSLPAGAWFRVPDTHEPIIEPELFARAAERQKQRVRRQPSSPRSHLFAGLLKCADCRRAMTRKQAKGRVYFHCSTYARKSKSACTIHSIRLDVLEQNVLNAVRDRLEQPDLPALSQELLASVIREILVHEDGTLSILFWEQESAVSHPVTQRPVRRAQPGQPAQPDPRGRRDRPALPDRKGRRDQPAPPAQPGQPDLPDRKARREYRGLPAPLAQPVRHLNRAAAGPADLAASADLISAGIWEISSAIFSVISLAAAVPPGLEAVPCGGRICAPRCGFPLRRRYLAARKR